MHPDEKVIDGVLCYRHKPADPWIPYSPEFLTLRILNLELALIEASNRIAETKSPALGRLEVFIPPAYAYSR